MLGIKAFVLVEAEAGKTGNVVEAVQELDGVKSADSVVGPYDVVVTTEITDLNAAGNLLKQIHSVSGVRKTTTLVGVKFY